MSIKHYTTIPFYITCKHHVKGLIKHGAINQCIAQLFWIILFIGNVMGQSKNNHSSKSPQPTDKQTQLINQFKAEKNTGEAAIIAFTLGEHFWFQRDINNAEHWFKISLATDSIPANDNQVVNACILLGNLYHHIGNFESAIRYADLAYTKITLQTNKKLLGNIFELKGRISHSLGKSEESIRFFVKADSIYSTSAHREINELGVYVKLVLAECFQDQNQQTKAKSYLDAAYASSINYKNERQQNLCLQALARWHFLSEAYAEAKKIYLAQIQKNSRRSALLYTYHGLGDIEYVLKNYTAALRHYETTLRIAVETKEWYMLDVFYKDLAKTYLAANMLPKAALYIDSSLQHTSGNLSNKVLAYDIKSKIDLANKDYKNAYLALWNKEKIIDSLNRKDVTELTNKLDIANNVKQKEARIDLLESEKQMMDQLNRQNKIIQYLLGLWIVLLIIAFVLIRNRIIRKKRMAQELAVKAEQDRISADLHDDIGSTLSSISVYSELADQLLSVRPEKSREMIQKISKQTRNMMDKMEDIIWSLKSVKNENLTFENQIESFAIEMLVPRNIKYHIELHPDINKLSTDEKAVRNILLIIKESMNNLGKYSNAAQAWIHMDISKNEYVLHIRDNGQGFDLSGSKSGNGLQNIKKRTSELKGMADITSTPGQGTTVMVRIPIASIRHFDTN